MNAPLDRLGRRGVLSITVEDGHYEVVFKAPGPYVGGRSTTDRADLFDYCRLGARDWRGAGRDLAALLATCDTETRPRSFSVDDLVWSIERRRDSRTAGPPLPSYRRWHGWRPGVGRWLRTFSHAHEYLDGYLRDLKEEQSFDAEQRESEKRRERRERDRVRCVLTGGAR